MIPGNDSTGEHLSVFLDSPEAAYTPQHMCPRAKFKLVLESTLGPDHALVKGAQQPQTGLATPSPLGACS